MLIVFLKGVSNRNHVNSEVKAMIADLQLVDKAQIQACRLSGGMKRKLRYMYYCQLGAKILILSCVIVWP